MNYWLMKSEPEAFGIDDLALRPKQTEHWDGVRNYQARNMLRDAMKLGDQVLFYHSNCKPPGIVGIAQVVREGYPDFSAFDPRDKHFDEKSDPQQPRWFMVDVQLVRKFRRLVSLDELKLQEQLEGMKILQRGNRLSITPVTKAHWDFILQLE